MIFNAGSILLSFDGTELIPFIFLMLIGAMFFLLNLLGNSFISVASRVIRLRQRMELTSEIMARYHSYLADFSYYRKLTEYDRKKFIFRLAEFMSTKDFIGADGLKVTERMKVLISASATQLMFGLPFYTLDIFHVIRVYPGIFYSKLMNLHMKGGTTRGGVIMLSWKDFELGYKDGSDKINLGLHELAHALKIEAVNGDEYGNELAERLDEWDAFTAGIREKVKAGGVPFLRKYGGTNAQEFWAVCVEHFFEAPAEFKRVLPQVYGHLRALLKQDPDELLTDNMLFDEELHPVLDPEEKKVIIPPRVNRSTFPSEVKWWGCLVLSIPVLAGLYGLTENSLMSTRAFLMTVLSFFLIGLILFFREWRRGEISVFLYTLQSFVLSGLVGTMLMLIINTMSAKAQEPEIYEIKNATPNYTDGVVSSYTYELTGDAYADMEKVRTFGNSGGKKRVALFFSEGVFGIRNFKGYQFVD